MNAHRYIVPDHHHIEERNRILRRQRRIGTLCLALSAFITIYMIAQFVRTVFQ